MHGYAKMAWFQDGPRDVLASQHVRVAIPVKLNSLNLLHGIVQFWDAETVHLSILTGSCKFAPLCHNPVTTQELHRK